MPPIMAGAECLFLVIMSARIENASEEFFW